MKKLFVAILAISALALTNVQAAVFNFGLTGGMNITKAEVVDNSSVLGWNPDSETGWYAGLQFRVSAPVIGIGLDLSALYSQQSLTVPGENNVDVTEKIGYLTVPVHLRYDLKLPVINDALTPFVFTGPRMSYNLDNLDDETIKRKLDLNDMVWHWDLGGGVILFEHLQISYHYGFPVTTTGEVKDFKVNDYVEDKTLDSDFKQGTHHIGLTLFF